MEHLLKKQASASVTAALAPTVDDVTVTITLKARIGDDTPAAPLLIEALQELIERCPDEPTGSFELRSGVDVAWKADVQKISNLRGH